MSAEKRISPLGEIATFVSGNRPQGGVGQIKEGALSLGGEHIGIDGKLALTTPKYVPLDYFNANPKGRITAGDILLCKDGALSGKVALERGELSGLQSMVNEHVFIIRTSKLYQKYLFYYLFSPIGQCLLKGIVTGAAQGGINGKNLKSIPVVYPESLHEQQRIVDELDLLTGIIDKKNAQLRDLDTLAQSIFYEMFGNPVTNDKGWPKKRIGELVHLYNGRAFKPTDWTESGLPIVRIQNLNSPDSPYNCYDGVVDEAYLLKGGELLYAWSGTPGTSFGAHIWKGEKAVLNQHIFKVLFDEKYLNKLYFLYQLNLSVSSLFDQTHGGVGLKHITKGTLENQLVPLPNMELQNSFAQKVLKIDSEKDRLKCSLLQTKALLESRMYAYFNTK